MTEEGWLEGTREGPPLPSYGRGSLAELLPSLLSALGMGGLANPLGVAPIEGLWLLVVDGLGWDIARSHPVEAPTMARLAKDGRPITAGFPATTATSLGSLGTGLAPGRHGLVGYTFAVPGHDRPLNALQWSLYGAGPPVTLGEDLAPERFQPAPTLIERSERAGFAVAVVGPPEHSSSPLTRAILRGGRYLGAHSLDDLVAVVAGAIADDGPKATYAYHPFLDTTAHLKGVGSEEWLAYLALVDRAVSDLADRVPPGWALVVTGDHGMLNLSEEQKVDVADRPELLAGVRMLGGEARAWHVYAFPGAAEDVLAVWRDVLGDHMWVATRGEALDAGWFGPDVPRHVRARIGDVVAAARGPVGVFQREVDALQAALVGHHGSMTPAEQLVPFLMVRG